jgi:hypothetical protein
MDVLMAHQVFAPAAKLTGSISNETTNGNFR